jgi:P-type Cu2+ transporter
MAADGAADWSVYDQPGLRDTVTAPRGRGREMLLALDGMHCAACAARVERTLAGRAHRVRVNLAARMVEFAFDPATQPLSGILGALDANGLGPRVLAEDASLRAQARERSNELARLGVSAILSMQVMMLAWPGYFADAPTEPALVQLLRWSQWLLATPVVLYGGWPFFRNAAQALRQGMLSMDVPVALALAIAYGASAWRTVAGSGEIWFDSATMFVLFLGTGRFLEGRTRDSAARRLRRLAGAQPLTARRIGAEGVAAEVAVGELRPGDHLQVRAGEAAPVDGWLLDAPGELDESLLTGESLPVRREPGARILAGSLNAGAAPLTIRASRVGPETHLSHVTRLLNRAQSGRPRFQQLADRLAGGFILAVLLLAGLGAYLALDRGTDAAVAVGLAVLVASCPCALSLAVPAAVAACSSRLAASGALLARPEALARLREADTVLFDKTGTLTQPGLALESVRTLADADEDRCRAIACALERDSVHPVARALRASSARNAGAELRAEDIRHEPARGVSGTVAGVHYWLGAPEFAPVPVPLPAAATPGLTRVALVDERRPLALFELSAAPRPEAAAVVRALRARGCDVELLTGDAPDTARALARHLGIARVGARQSPEDKLLRLRELQAAGRHVIAVGDGINDAPFLAGADVAVAMPQGAALAQARADVVLMGDSLEPLPHLLDAARRAMRIARQNLAWALAYNVVVLPLAMTGSLAPAFAALGMAASSLLVVGNALRLSNGPRPAAGPRDKGADRPAAATG